MKSWNFCSKRGIESARVSDDDIWKTLLLSLLPAHVLIGTQVVLNIFIIMKKPTKQGRSAKKIVNHIIIIYHLTLYSFMIQDGDTYNNLYLKTCFIQMILKEFVFRIQYFFISINFKAILIYRKKKQISKCLPFRSRIHLLYIPIDFIFQEDNL